MDALKIALETVFVEVLALPWLALAADLFFPQFFPQKISDPEGWLAKLQSIKSETVGYAVVGVLSVAMVYTLGAALSRLAQDFFNDDDLLWHLPTEDEIRASVYCDSRGNRSAVDDQGAPSKADIVGSAQLNTLCTLLSAASKKPQRDSVSDQIQQIFRLQEAALLLAGDDKVSRIRLLHQQLNVLRGPAFDGVITCLAFCFGWCAQREGKWRRWPWEILPIGLFCYVFYALLWNHLQISPLQLFQHPSLLFRPPDDPPFMEFTLLLLAVAGCYVIARGAKGAWPRGTGWVSLLFTALAYSGWSWTEILYDRLIIYSYYASQHSLPK